MSRFLKSPTKHSYYDSTQVFLQQVAVQGIRQNNAIDLTKKII